jgi:chemotaxis protein CheD
MADTSVKLLECGIASSGLLKIDQIGSGMGVILYSPSQKIGAGLHILAPRSGKMTAKSPVMYADTAIPYAIEQLARKGVKPPLSVAIAGGASLLRSQTAFGSSQKMAEAVKEALQKASLQVKMEDTGGAKIRSMILDIDAGKIKIV